MIRVFSAARQQDRILVVEVVRNWASRHALFRLGDIHNPPAVLLKSCWGTGAELRQLLTHLLDQLMNSTNHRNAYAVRRPFSWSWRLARRPAALPQSGLC